MSSGKDAYWFPHDSNARNDMKLVHLKRIGGHMAIGCYWELIETLRDEAGYKLPKELIGEVEYSCRWPEGMLNKIKEAKLIEEDDQFIWSASLVRRMISFDRAKESRQRAGRKGGKNRSVKYTNDIGNIQAKPKQCLSNAQAKPKQSSSKNSRVEESTVQKRTEEKPIASFEAWWSGVQNKIAKKKASLAWNRVQKANNWPQEKWTSLAKTLSSEQERLINSGASPIHPATWLNGERWNDDPAPTPAPRPSKFTPPETHGRRPQTLQIAEPAPTPQRTQEEQEAIAAERQRSISKILGKAVESTEFGN